MPDVSLPDDDVLVKEVEKILRDLNLLALRAERHDARDYKNRVRRAAIPPHQLEYVARRIVRHLFEKRIIDLTSFAR